MRKTVAVLTGLLSLATCNFYREEKPRPGHSIVFHSEVDVLYTDANGDGEVDVISLDPPIAPCLYAKGFESYCEGVLAFPLPDDQRRVISEMYRKARDTKKMQTSQKQTNPYL